MGRCSKLVEKLRSVVIRVIKKLMNLCILPVVDINLSLFIDNSEISNFQCRYAATRKVE